MDQESMSLLLLVLQHLISKELQSIHLLVSQFLIAFSHEGINTEGKSSVLNSNPAMKKRWKEAKVLVIDEVSMLSADMFEQIDTTARYSIFLTF